MSLDKRIHAFRDDLADEALKSQVSAKRFVKGETAYCGLNPVSLRHEPSHSASLDTMLLPLEKLVVFEISDEFSWVQAQDDGYVGYVENNKLYHPRSSSDGPVALYSHFVATASTFIYPHADIKSPPKGALSFASKIFCKALESKDFFELLYPDGSSLGYGYASHFERLNKSQKTIVEYARQFLNMPYLWGGRVLYGIDCSALVQLVFRPFGIYLPRDSDLQFSSFDQTYKKERSDLAAGDLIYWKGHVALATSSSTMIHASGHHMLVVEEPIDAAIDRIKNEWGAPIGFIQNPIDH